MLVLPKLRLVRFHAAETEAWGSRFYPGQILWPWGKLGDAFCSHLPAGKTVLFHSSVEHRRGKGFFLSMLSPRYLSCEADSDCCALFWMHFLTKRPCLKEIWSILIFIFALICFFGTSFSQSWKENNSSVFSGQRKEADRMSSNAV